MSRRRGKLLVINSIASLFSQFATVICGFVLTRLILSNFGTDVNGLVASISQFLGLISFLELGIGAVVKSALYKPLAEKNNTEIGKVVISAKAFFRRIAYIFIVYTIILMVAFPVISKDNFGAVFTASLVVIISLSLFAQYFFGMPYQLLLNADQKTYIPTIVCCTTLVLNTILSGVLIYLGASIQIVKLTTSIIYIIRPLFYNLYVKKHYTLNEKLHLESEPLEQKWNGFAQHLAYAVVNNTDIVVLTCFSTLANVSIYTVYHNVTIGIQQVISSISVGIAAMLGNVLYSEDAETLKKTFGLVEWFFHSMTVLLFTITGLLIIPFVQIYTDGVNDDNYIMPIFAVLITVAQASFSIRTPYQTMVNTANHFRQTQKSAFIEVAINIIVSIALVIKFGLIGVAIGTVAAMTYRTLYYVIYLKKNILYYEISNFIKLITLDIVQVGIAVIICFFVSGFYMDTPSWGNWLILAIKDGVICVLVSAIINFIFNKKYILDLKQVLIKKRK